MRAELVDVLMIDVGCTDVTWSHAWNSVWVSSYRHFLAVCGWLVNIIRGSRGCWSSWTSSRCTLFSALVLRWTSGSVSTVLAPGYPWAPPPHLLEPKPWVSFIVNNRMYYADIFIQKQPHPLCFPPCHDVCLSSCWSDFHIESSFQNFTLTSEISFSRKRKRLWKAPPLCQEWQNTGNLMYWFLFQGELGLRGKDAGEENWWANEGFRERNGRGRGIGIYVFTSCPDFAVYGELCWTNIPLRFTICPFRDAQVTLNWKGKKFNWYLDDTSLGTRIDFA